MFKISNKLAGFNLKQFRMSKCVEKAFKTLFCLPTKCALGMSALTAQNQVKIYTQVLALVVESVIRKAYSCWGKIWVLPIASAFHRDARAEVGCYKTKVIKIGHFGSNVFYLFFVEWSILIYRHRLHRSKFNQVIGAANSTDDKKKKKMKQRAEQ